MQYFGAFVLLVSVSHHNDARCCEVASCQLYQSIKTILGGVPNCVASLPPAKQEEEGKGWQCLPTIYISSQGDATAARLRDMIRDAQGDIIKRVSHYEALYGVEIKEEATDIIVHFSGRHNRYMYCRGLLGGGDIVAQRTTYVAPCNEVADVAR